MATIRARKQSDGSTRYTAIVRVRSGKTIVYREYKTFALRTAAASWAKHREVALEQSGALTRVTHGAPPHALGQLNALTLTSARLIEHVRSRRAQLAGPATVANDLIWTGVVLRAARSVKGLPVRLVSYQIDRIARSVSTRVHGCSGAAIRNNKVSSSGIPHCRKPMTASEWCGRILVPTYRIELGPCVLPDRIVTTLRSA
jgi:hypothetical protein